jgi:hypothetical protein
MADRYQGRPFPADDDYNRSGDPHTSASGEGDPLAELARLIGQTEQFSGIGRANLPLQPPRANAREQYRQPDTTEPDEGLPPGPPPWIQRAARQESAQQQYSEDHSSAVHSTPRYSEPHVAPEPDYHQPAASTEANHEPDPSRYDDVMYGRVDGAQ